MSSEEQDKPTPDPAPQQEGAARRRQRRGFFKAWLAWSIIGFVAILAAAASAIVFDQTGKRVAAILTIAVVASLLFSALIWLIYYIASGNRRETPPED